MTALILSGSYIESARYIQSEGIRGRHATNAESIGGVYFTEIIELPSFNRRPDRHTVRAALKRKLRGHNRVEWRVLDGLENGDRLTPEEETELIEVLDELQESGAPSAEDEALQDIVAPEAPDDAKEPEPKPAAKPKRPRKPVPAPPKTVTSSIDDLFGDD